MFITLSRRVVESKRSTNKQLAFERRPSIVHRCCAMRVGANMLRPSQRQSR